MTIDDKYQITFIQKITRLNIETSQIKIAKVDENQSRLIDHHQIKGWTETSFTLDPVVLLRLQYLVTQKEKDEEHHNIAIHTS